MKKDKSFKEDWDTEDKCSKKVNFKKFLNSNIENLVEDEFEDVSYLSSVNLKKIEEDGDIKRLIVLDSNINFELQNEDMQDIMSLRYEEDMSISDDHGYNWHITRSSKDDIVFENDDQSLEFLPFKMKFSEFIKKLK